MDVDWDMIIIAALAEEEEEEEKWKRKRKMWVNEIWLSRNLTGEYETMAKNLMGQDFYNYVKMSREKFDALLNLLGPHIRKQNTNYRPAISSEERLLIFLR